MKKVYNDINESKYEFVYDSLKFYFSSEFYLNKFKNEYVEFIKNETMKLRLKFRCNFYADEMIMILLYKRIEKRGFRVYKSGKKINSLYISCNLNYE